MANSFHWGAVKDFFIRWKKDIIITSVSVVFGIIVLGLGNFLVACLAVAAIFGDALKNRWAGPNLYLALKEEKGNLTTIKITTMQEDKVLESQMKGLYRHIEIINRRKTVPAKKVRVLLTGTYRKNAVNKFVKLALGGPIQMFWVPAEMHGLDPFPTVTLPRSVDLGHIAEYEDQFVPGIVWTPNNFDGFVRKNDTLRYTFEIDAENFASKEAFCIEVNWDGLWISEEDEMNNHLIVKIVEYGDWALQQAT